MKLTSKSNGRSPYPYDKKMGPELKITPELNTTQ